MLFHAVAPLVDLKVKAGPANGSTSGLADMVFGTGLGYHASDKLHYVWAVDVTAPTGSYDSNKLANLGRNYWNIEPVFAMTYVQPTGINADVKVMYDFNGVNHATDYRSGQELHADYSVGWALGNGWTVGVGGFVYQQITDDKKNGATVANNKGRAYAIGPSVKYDSGKGWFLERISKQRKVVNILKEKLSKEDVNKAMVQSWPLPILWIYAVKSFRPANARGNRNAQWQSSLA